MSGPERVPITAVVVGERRREEMGDIAELARSMREHGLMHPIVVDDHLNLIAGGRRLAAAQSLGWTEIAVTRTGEVSEDALRAMELDENTKRKALSDFERAKVFKAKSLPGPGEPAAKLPRVRPDGKRMPGPAPDPMSLRSRAKRAGAKDETEVRRNDRIVELGETYPFMQAIAWKDSHILTAGKALEAIPEEDRAAAAGIVAQPGIPPQRAVKVLEKMAAMPRERRAEVVALWRRGDPEAKSLALTEAAQLPPMPDPREVRLAAMVKELAVMVGAYPGRAGTEALAEVVERLRDVLREIKRGSNNGHA